jgi:hypothetical protein
VARSRRERALAEQRFTPVRGFPMRSVLLLTLFVVSGPARADEKVDTSKVRDLAETVGKAVLDNDFAKVADLTHPKIVEIMGGKDKMVEKTGEVMAGLKAQGLAFSKYTVGKVGNPVVDGKTAYIVVPTTIVLTAPTMKIESESYLLGISTDGGKTWRFADGAGLSNPTLRDKVFPSLPAALKLPEKQQPKVTKE